MKNIFLDCGTHFGQGLNHFFKKFNMNNSWHIESYEANPITYKIHEPNREYEFVQYKNIALNTYDGIVEFNIEDPAHPHEPDTGMGSSIITLDKWNPQEGRLKFKKQIKVDCINFSNYIKTNFNKNDYIVCKMDIEGAEYNILKQMIDDNTLDYIDELFVEFHASYFNNKQEMLQIENNIKNKIYNNTKTILHNWG
jgi:FkbM family methyltransferase